MSNYRKALKSDIPCIKCKYSRETSYSKEVKTKRIRCFYSIEYHSACGAKMTCDKAARS